MHIPFIKDVLHLLGHEPLPRVSTSTSHMLSDTVRYGEKQSALNVDDGTS